MLADLTLIGCYNRTYLPENERNTVMLRSAKENLKKMSFFGIFEMLHQSQFVFEKIFDFKFVKPILNTNESKSSNVTPTENQMQKIIQLNSLDIQLYEFARDLFVRRFEELKAEDPMFVFNYAV